MLNMLGQDEVNAILKEQTTIRVSCNFCGKPYEFDAVDCGSLFVDRANTPDTRNPSVH